MPDDLSTPEADLTASNPAPINEAQNDASNSAKESLAPAADAKPPVRSILEEIEEPVKPATAKKSSLDKALEAQPQKGEVYEFKTPEGVELPPELMKGFEDEAHGLKLNGEQAQKLLDMGVRAVEQQKKEQLSQWEKTLEEETRSLETDEKLGGKNYNQTRMIAARAYNAIKREMSPAAQTRLDALMIGGRISNFKAVAEFLHAIGQRFFREDGPVLDNTSPGHRPQPEGFNYEAVKSVFGKRH